MKRYFFLLIVLAISCKNVKESTAAIDISQIKPNPSEWLLIAKVTNIDKQKSIDILIQEPVKKGMGTSGNLRKGDKLILELPKTENSVIKKDQIIALRIVETIKLGSNLPDFQIIEIISK